MFGTVENLLTSYERGALSRRDLVKGLALLAIPGAVGTAEAQAPKSLTSAVCLNHIAFPVSNLERTTQFYGELLGAKIMAKRRPTGWTLTIPGATPERGAWMSLTQVKSGDGAKPGTYDHLAFGVAPIDKFKLAAEINRKFPFAKAKANSDPKTQRGGLYLVDPDGLKVQLVPAVEQGEDEADAPVIPPTAW